MKSVLIRNISCLAGIRGQDGSMVKGAKMASVNSVTKAFVLIEEGKIAAFGNDDEAPEFAEEIIDGTGRVVLPCWCDAHTHLVFPGWREREFVYRISGWSYEEIAAAGGGIQNTARQLSMTSDDELFESAMNRLDEIRATGTGAVEIKSGYGLSAEGELKILRVIRRLKENSPLLIKATFLGAHAVPGDFVNRREEYINLLIESLLPKIADDGLADFIDVYCEKGYFSVAETEQILEAGVKYGLQPKIHVNQFNVLGGVAAGVKFNALSVDHLEYLSDEDIGVLKNSNTMPTALPGCSFFLQIPYTPARRMIDAGLPLALASDYNPGTSPSGNMNLIWSLACTQMKMSVAEGLNAGTINGAYAMNIAHEAGSITVGKRANLMITRPVPSMDFLPYSFGNNHLDRVIIGGD